jgi:hypothetical protein
MSRRLRELLAAADLAKLQDEQTAREGANAAANTGQWINALQAIVPAASSALGAYQGNVAKDADTAAAQEIANHVGDVGDDVDTPSAIAANAVGANEKLTPKKPSGLIDSLGALLGNRASAAAAAKAKATAGITGEVMANREKAKAASTRTTPTPAIPTFKLDQTGAADGDTLSMPEGVGVNGLPKGAKAAFDEGSDMARVAQGGRVAALLKPSLSLDDQLKQARIDSEKAKADALWRKNAGGGGGAPSVKDQMAAERLKALQAKNAAGGKKSGIISPEEMQRKVDEANELAALYDKGGFGTGVAAGAGVGPLASDDLLRARQLSTELAFGVPAAFSGSRRLNDTEFKKSLSHIAGAPESAMTNKQKATMARALASDLSGMLEEMNGARAAQGTPSAPSTTEQHGAGGTWQQQVSSAMDNALAPAMGGQPQGNPIDAAHVFRAMSPPQQAKVKALIAQGVDRVTATMRVAQGG